MENRWMEEGNTNLITGGSHSVGIEHHWPSRQGWRKNKIRAQCRGNKYLELEEETREYTKLFDYSKSNDLHYPEEHWAGTPSLWGCYPNRWSINFFQSSLASSSIIHICPTTHTLRGPPLLHTDWDSHRLRCPTAHTQMSNCSHTDSDAQLLTHRLKGPTSSHSHKQRNRKDESQLHRHR